MREFSRVVEKESIRKHARESWETWVPKILEVAKQVPSTSAKKLLEEQEDGCEGTHLFTNYELTQLSSYPCMVFLAAT